MKSHKLTTLFYLIESPNYLEKYIGLTTRTLQQRFNEHKKSKEWIIDNSFSINVSSSIGLVLLLFDS